MACEFLDNAIVCSRADRRQPVKRCACGRLAKYLCDAPAGQGKTCDAPLCEVCSWGRTGGVDLCEAHWKAVNRHDPGHKEVSP